MSTHSMRRRRTTRMLAVTAAAAALALTLGACSSGQPEPSSSSGGGLPAEIELTSLLNQSGVVSLIGKDSQAGQEFAIQQLNEEKFLGDTKLSIKFEDTKTDPQRAVQLASAAVAAKPPVVLSPLTSAENLAIAPILQRGSVPLVIHGAMVEGLVETGDFIFRTTAPQGTYQQAAVDRLKELGVKKMILVYTADNPGTKSWAETTMKPLLADNGIEVVESIGIAQSQTDFSSVATKVADWGEDTAVGLAVQGTANGTIVTQMRDQGFKGHFVGDNNFASGTLAAAGDKAKGAFCVVAFSPELDFPSTKAFVEAWGKAHNGEVPSAYASEGYTMVLFAVTGIKNANSVDPVEVQKGLLKASQDGIEAGPGPITFKDRDARVEGALIVWDGEKFVAP
ncbi:ABC transporter substrate-binding protein [Microbacterium sp.]|uniref:ABC transporter substrate-binding protein n=1 Tax=Microbacterium sp. TaxID=51671 RepID=UPI0039E46ACA